jgi:glutamate 5-kinase
MTLSKAKRVVLKIGSALLVDAETRRIREEWLASVAADIAHCRKQGQEIIVVTSGAVAVGLTHLGLVKSPSLKLEEKQAAAATGQIRLAHAYQEKLSEHSLTVAQLLLTLDDTEERHRHLNARRTLETLLRLGAIPLINENDTVATAEIRFGDNDRLAARVAQMCGADTLILFSDIDGLYTADPRDNPNAEHLSVVEKIDARIEKMAGKAPVGFSSGGMVTKLIAAQIATNAGCQMLIANGRAAHPLQRLLEGERHTLFLANTTPLSARKKWLASMLAQQGAVVIDEGAEHALNQGKSLLPAGILRVEGTFERGDAIHLKNAAGKPLATGLASYSSAEITQLCGKQTRDIEIILGYHGGDEVVHRDDYVLLER